jgi:hypothetical protein
LRDYPEDAGRGNKDDCDEQGNLVLERSCPRGPVCAHV